MSDASGTDAATAGSQGRASSIGARLRAAREQRELTPERVAQQLRLDVEVIAALEGDRADELAAPIFVQGYLRSYARLLDLPEDEIVAGRGQGTSPPPLTIKHVKSATPVLSLPSVRLARNVLLVVLAGLLAWLAWPLVDRVLEMRGEPAGEQSPGYLEIPPPPGANGSR